MKYKTALILMTPDLMTIGSGSLLSPWKFGYESGFFPMYDYNHEISECRTDSDCQTMYMHNKDYSDFVIVRNHADELYNGFYELAEPWGGQPHWTNENRTAHIYYYLDSNDQGWWCLDDRNQDPDNIQGYADGGYRKSNDNSTYGLVSITPTFMI